MPSKSAVLIAGPTASGKSALAVALASRLGGIIINADSMQVYRELPILTARPRPEDVAAAPHRLYGHVPAAEAYSTGRWLTDVPDALAHARSANKLPIIAGGTGLYFEALLNGLSPIPAIPPEIRAYWRAEAERLGPNGLHAELAARDAVMAGRLMPTDPQRITRALEVLEATGRSLADWQTRSGVPLLRREHAICLVLAPRREALYARCNARFGEMMAEGALAEAAALMALGLPAELPAMRATGVRELMAHLRGELSLEAAVDAAKAETRRYAKRQATWIRGRMADWTVIESVDRGCLTGEVARALD